MNMMMMRPMEDHFAKPRVVDMFGLMTLDDISFNMEKRRITTNLQVHPPPQRKCLLEWVM